MIFFSRIKDTNLRKIKSHDNFSNLTTSGGGTKPLADLEKRKKGKFYLSDIIRILSGSFRSKPRFKINRGIFDEIMMTVEQCNL